MEKRIDPNAIYVERDKLVRAEKVADIVRGERNSALEELARVTEERDSLQAKLDEAVDKALELAKERDALRDKLERSMELPLDADGVPIHVGDTITYGDYSQGIVKAVGEWMVVAMHVDDDNLNYAKYGLLWEAEGCRHVKPRTIEDVLSDFRAEADMIYNDPKIGGVERADELSALDAKYADEIRKVVGE